MHVQIQIYFVLKSCMTVTKLNYMKVKLAPELSVKIPIKNFKNIPENVYSLHFRAQTDRQTDRHGLEVCFTS